MGPRCFPHHDIVVIEESGGLTIAIPSIEYYNVKCYDVDNAKIVALVQKDMDTGHYRLFTRTRQLTKIYNLLQKYRPDVLTTIKETVHVSHF